VLNCGTTPVSRPRGEVVASSGPVSDLLPGDTAVWVRD
jgi:alpha-glucosidase